MRKRFKSYAMQRMYAACRTTALDKSSEFWIDGKPRLGGAAHRVAYWAGFNGEPPRYLRNTLAYAAWAAGQDNERAGR